MDKDKLFIIASAYDCENSISEFLDSIIYQTFSNWNLLLVDDCSSDNTKSIILSYVQVEKRISLISNLENLGLTKSLIKAINFVPNESYIVRMDTDEAHSKFYLKDISEIINKTKCSLILNSDSDFCIKILNLFNPTSRALFITLFGNIFFHGKAVFSKELYMKTNGYKKFAYYGQDYLLWVKMLYLSRKTIFTRCRNFKVKQLINNNRISIKNNIEQSNFAIFAINEFLDLFINRKRKILYKSLFYFLLVFSLILRSIRFIMK